MILDEFSNLKHLNWSSYAKVIDFTNFNSNLILNSISGIIFPKEIPNYCAIWRQPWNCETDNRAPPYSDSTSLTSGPHGYCAHRADAGVSV